MSVLHPLTETILWARKNDKKSRHYYNYELMKEFNDGKQMKDVWTGSLTKNQKNGLGNIQLRSQSIF